MYQYPLLMGKPSVGKRVINRSTVSANMEWGYSSVVTTTGNLLFSELLSLYIIISVHQAWCSSCEPSLLLLAAVSSCFSGVAWGMRTMGVPLTSWRLSSENIQGCVFLEEYVRSDSLIGVDDRFFGCPLVQNAGSDHNDGFVDFVHPL